ncbi:hypothetical protein GCM10027422_42350 [Hymenobacter arcticus]
MDGTYCRGLLLPPNPNRGVLFAQGDRVRVELEALTADNYYCLNEVRIQLNNSGLFAPPLARLRTNVRNLAASSPKKAVGYFASHTVRAKSLIIR